MVIVIASHNVHKIRELREMFKRFPHIDVLSLLNFPHYVPLEETGATFKENAILKATHAAKTLNHHVLADDSGLVVPCLNGAPGVFSKRYAGEEATEAENRQKLLHELKDKQQEACSAYLECCLALALPSGLLKKCYVGTCDGIILKEERGRNGFGYDSLFLKHDYDKTFAEIDDSTKNRISHRRKAFEKLTSVLENLMT